MNTNIQESIIDVLYQTMDQRIDKKKITSNSNLIDDIGISSLEVVQLLVGIEERLEIAIQLETFDYNLLNNVGKFAEFIAKQPKRKSNK